MPEYKKPSVTTDIVIFTIQDNELKVLLIKRKIEPFKDSWAIPGGFVQIAESLDQAATRELEEETGIKDVYLEQLYTFGDPKRDPRGRVITVSYMALVDSNKIELKPDTDASEAQWFSTQQLPNLETIPTTIPYFRLRSTPPYLPQNWYATPRHQNSLKRKAPWQ